MHNYMVSWSGGKDSCYATQIAVEKGANIVAVMNMMNENGEFSRSHCIPKDVLKAQAKALGAPLFTCPASWKEFESKYISMLGSIKKDIDFEGIVFGDIDLEPHREWEEKVSSSVGVKAVLPLWQKDRKELVLAMISNQIEAVIVSCNNTMGKEFLGRKIDKQLLEELEALGVDACGENGEYHTLVTNCKLFKSAVNIEVIGKISHEHYNFLEFKLA
tara:strand:- start:1187 stop:1837 length:651 start_codon:yes stop_codon:yes gene_type:complete